MRIYRRKGSKIWQYYWRGKRGSTGFTDRPAAEAWFRELQRREADPTYRAPDPTATVVKELEGFIEQQRTRKRKRAPETFKMYELHARILTSELGAETPIAALDAARLDALIASLSKSGASDSYVWKIWCTLRGTLKRARKQRRYPYALDEVTPNDLQPAYVPLTRHLLMPDVLKLMAELEPERRAVVAFLVAFGADLGCVPRAQPGDIDLRAGVAHVRGSKTTHRNRVMPIVPPFEALAEEAAKGLPFAPWPSCRRDLIRAAMRAGVGPLEPRHDKTYRKRSGKEGTLLGRIITARDLRRSHGRILRAAGVEPSLIGPMLGHAPGSPVTALTYAQIQPQELGAQIRGAVSRSGTPARKTPKKPVKRKVA